MAIVGELADVVPVLPRCLVPGEEPLVVQFEAEGLGNAKTRARAGMRRSVRAFGSQWHETDVDRVVDGDTVSARGRVAILLVPGDGDPLLSGNRCDVIEDDHVTAVFEVPVAGTDRADIARGGRLHGATWKIKPRPYLRTWSFVSPLGLMSAGAPRLTPAMRETFGSCAAWGVSSAPCGHWDDIVSSRQTRSRWPAMYREYAGEDTWIDDSANEKEGLRPCSRLPNEFLPLNPDR